MAPILDGQQDQLIIRTLGSFSVEQGTESLSENSNRQQQIWTLFKYILNARRRRIPPEEFVDVLWRTEPCDNPAKALQNLVYRLRRELSRFGAKGSAYILLKQGCYCWNNQAPARIDVDVFEETYIRATGEELAGHHETAARLYKDCLALYRGDYMSEIASLEWVLPTVNYYKRLFINVATHATQLLHALTRYDEVLAICEQAFRFEPYEEQLHAAFIRALLALGKPKQARSHYEFITSALYREFGLKPSPLLKDVYQAIYQPPSNASTDLNVLQDLLAEKEQPPEAFQCEADLFRSIYKLEARRAARSGQNVYLALLTVMPCGPATPDSTLLSRAMDHLGSVLLTSLRRGDVVSRWNNSQYVVMLTSLTYEDSAMVAKRLQDRFAATFPHQGVQIRHKLQALNAAL